MRVDDLTALKLDPALRECDLHLRRLHYALTQLQPALFTTLPSRDASRCCGWGVSRPSKPEA